RGHLATRGGARAALNTVGAPRQAPGTNTERRDTMRRTERVSRQRLARVGLGLAAAGVLAAPLAFELRLKRPGQPLTDAWRAVPVEPRGSARLGISFRPLQAEALGLDGPATPPTS